MSKNLRIVDTNLADIAELTASTTVGDYIVSNIKKDAKSSVWRSNSPISSVSGVWDSEQTVACLIIPYTNLVANATVRLRLYSDTSKTVLVKDTGVRSTNIFQHGNTLNSSYGYGGGSCVMIYFTKVANCRAFTIDFVNTNQAYVEVSRVILGEYWSPEYNTEFGISVGLEDTSTEIRTDAGDLISEVSPVHKVLTFSLSFMSEKDRDALFSIARKKGRHSSVHVSLFPEDVDKNKEYLYQVYGRFTQNIAITHPMYTIYSTSLSIQEV
jgi:hypothetical protein